MSFKVPIITEHPLVYPPLILSFVADGGLAGANQSAVANLIKSWKPHMLLFGGDNNYPSGITTDLATNWGQYSTERTAERVFPALGNHDLDTDNGTPQTNYFDYLPGNRRYYSVRQQHVEVFVLNSGFNTAGTLVEPDGNDIGSDQEEWLADQVAVSDAYWKLVVLHHAPYTSDVNYTPGSTTLRWDFLGIGIDAVLSGHGHNYERLLVNGLNYFVTGTGGHSLRGFAATPLSQSQKRYSSAFGALRIDAEEERLHCRFYNVSGTKIDDVHIEKGLYDYV